MQLLPEPLGPFAHLKPQTSLSFPVLGIEPRASHIAGLPQSYNLQLSASHPLRLGLPEQTAQPGLELTTPPKPTWNLRSSCLTLLVLGPQARSAVCVRFLCPRAQVSVWVYMEAGYQPWVSFLGSCPSHFWRQGLSLGPGACQLEQAG